MKRHAALAKFSREHHFALVIARRAKQAIGDAPEIALAFSQDIETHFVKEEAHLLPALEMEGQAALVARTLADHDALRELARRLAAGDPEALRKFGELLEKHVRFEERELFPLAESALTQEVLDRIARQA